MITVEDREAIRRAYYLNRKSKRQIAREQGHSRKTIDKAVENLPPQPYRLTKPKAAPVFGPFQARADVLLAENEPLHYLCLLEQRPGAFDYARPLKKWQAGWEDALPSHVAGVAREMA